LKAVSNILRCVAESCCNSELSRSLENGEEDRSRDEENSIYYVRDGDEEPHREEGSLEDFEKKTEGHDEEEAAKRGRGEVKGEQG